MRQNGRPVLVTAVLLWACTAQGADIYLLTGTPNHSYFGDSYALRLLRVRAGSAEMVTEVVAEERGIEWVGLSPKRAKALVLARKPWELLVLDLTKAAITKRCPVAIEEGDYLYLSAWGAELADGDYAFQMSLKDSTTTINPDPTLACSASVSTTNGIDLSRRVVDGAIGGDEVLTSEEEKWWIHDTADGRILRRERTTRLLRSSHMSSHASG